ncbi:melanoma inhibitory activity protein 2 isoform X2 [Xenopus tropicalis]|uniref:Melanoma inhibitory activity protein 2 isoform X2 n=1 Tax=Xenopus tropicalis TaxID=8364 RepID=A0A8J0SV39_XENTR|nr:melanoma inhibitory activity protein 2 isoform X2 [Xenopus tropicalis]
MVEQWGHRIVVLGLLLSVPLQSQKILSDKKKCADPHCESLMFRAQAIQDYNGPDCRYLSFKVGAEIIVYYKLSGKREDLWQGSTGKEYGFFPMHTVTIEEIYVTEEVEVDAQEIDFVCLNGGEYVFENEDSVLLKPEESEYARDLESKVIKDNKFVGNTETNTETNIQTSENLEEIDKSKWSTSSIAGWFGIGESEDKQSTEINTEPVKEDTFHSRKIAISEEMEIKGTDEVELKKSGWLSSQFTNFLPFGKREVDAPVQKEKTDDVVSAHTSQSDEMKMNVKEIPTEASTSTEPQSKWFNFAIKDVFGVGSKDEVKIKDVHEHGDIILENEPSEISSDGEELTATNSEDREETFDETKSQEKGGSCDSQLLDDFSCVMSGGKGSQSIESVISENQNTLQSYKELHNEDISENSYTQSYAMPNWVNNKEDRTVEIHIEARETIYEGQSYNSKENKEMVQADSGKTENHDMANGQKNSSKLSLEPSLNILPNTDTNGINTLVQTTTGTTSGDRDEPKKTYTDEIENQFTAEINSTVSPKEENNKSQKSFIPQVDLLESQDKKDLDTLKNNIYSSNHIDEASPKENTVVDLPLDDKIEQMYAENTVNSTKTQEENIKINEFSADGTKEKHKILSTDNPIVSETFRTELSSDIGNPNTDCDISSNTKIHKTVAQDFLSKNELSEHSQELETAAERIPTFQPGYDTLKEELDLPQENTFHQGQKLNARMEKASESTTLSFKELTAFGEMAASEILEIYTNWICPAVSSIVRITKQVMSTLSDLLPDSDFYGCSWEVVAFTALFGFSTVLLFTCRTVRSIKSRCYAGREKKLSAKFSEAVNGKSEVLQKLSIIQKQYEEVQQSLEDSSHQRLLAEITEQKTLQETLQKSNCDLEEKILKLEQELEEEKALGLELETKISNVNEKIKTLEDDLKKGKSQKEEIHTTMKVFEINQGRLETSSQDAIEERSHLQESIKQLSKEAEGWEERFSELAENSKMLSSSVDAMHEDMNNKQIQIKSLIDNLLKMKDWGPEMDEVEEGEDLSIPNLTWDFENGESLADPQKRTIKKLIYAAMLNASLRSTESEKKQLYDNLSDEMKVKEQLLECINNLQNTKQSLISEKEQLEGDVENMKHKMSVMSEMYQENEKKLHRKLTVQEKERIQKEEKLSKVDEKIHLATGELLTVKTRVKELEDEIEKTVYSYQSQVTSYEKKSHDNWLTARAAERHLSEIKKETAHFRQKLIEAEYKVELLEKDPFALDVIHAIGRAYADVFINHQDSSPYGISPISRLPDSRAFLSPPTLLEGPLRLSPMLPGVDRGVRPPGYYPAHGGVKERGDINADRKADQQRTHSDAGSLSPPWERDHKASMPPPGLPYPELPFPSRRPERFYQYPVSSGRFSGPAELTRNQGISFTDLPDGQSANTIRNGSEDNDTLHGSSNQPLLKEGETADVPPMAYAVHPLPPMRVPLLPMDPRGPYFRRPFPMQPPPVDMYPPPEYPGIPPIHATMRSPLPPHHYPPFPMHGDQFFPPPHLRQPIRSEHLPDPPPVASETQEKPPEPTA